ncbi:hypothetical protein ACGF12_22640 [Kitasatospora sp. NPDC048296]|uniref:hypothetical protein n=1 Tax=Kitasatospora sp. NPDC048296 TaxID=3364048 RepID=UPI0037225208
MTDLLTWLSTGADGTLACNGLDYIEFDVRIARDPSCPSTSRAAYMALAAFADMEHHVTLTAEAVAGWSREVRQALLPYRKTIAACMGRSANTFDRAADDLVQREVLIVTPQQDPNHPGAADANLYRLVDRERWARQVLERAANPAPTLPLLGADGRPVPRVLRTPGIDFIKLDARIVTFGGRSPNYKSVYAAIATFVNLNSRAVTERPPTIRELMACTGLGRTAVTDALAQLRADGVLLMKDQYAPKLEGGGRLASSYALLDGRLWRARAAAREEREIAQFTGGSTHQPDMGGLPTTRMGVYPPAGQGSTHHADIIKRSSENRRGEPLPDARRASTGGKAREPRAARAAKPAAQVGSADDRTKKPRTKTIRTTPSRPVPGEEVVFAAIDALGVSKHPALRVPPLRRAVRDLLSAGRTTDHALARIDAGWWKAGVPERIAKGEIRGPVGYLATILSRQDCEMADCERGLLLGSGEECRACGLRAAERAADRARHHLEEQTPDLDTAGEGSGNREPASREDEGSAGPVTWRCQAPGPDGFGAGVCGRPGRGTPPPLPMCPDCLSDLHRALAR